MARCQVCDGPVVNGRCKLCGMPYRNDEVLYHLNESRSEHYKHATTKARAQMRENQIPIADRKEKTAKNVAAGKTQTAKSTAAGKKIERTTAPTVANTAKNMQAAKRAGLSGEKRQRTKRRMWPAIAIVIFILAANVLPEAVEYIKDACEFRWAERKINNAEKARIDPEEYLLLGIMDLEQPEMLVGDSYDNGMVMPGEYALEVSDGFRGRIELIVQYAENGKTDEYFVFFKGGEQITAELHKGDKLSIREYEADDEYYYVKMFLIEQYDESAEM